MADLYAGDGPYVHVAITAWELQLMKWTVAHTVAIIGVIVFIVLIALFPAFLSAPVYVLPGWWLLIALLVFSLLVIGKGITGSSLGVLIDDRNRMSLTRLQLVAWTVLVISAYLAAALWNVRSGATDPLLVQLPGELLVLLGITSTSVIASPLIRSSKTAAEPDPTQAERTITTVATHRKAIAVTVPSDLKTRAIEKATGSDPGAQVGREGSIVQMNDPALARVADLFQGEETGNAAQVDIGKVQMFYFTVIVILVYGMAIGGIFSNLTGKITSLPVLDQGIVGLLGLSHASYIAYKAAPHSKQAP